MILDPRRAMHVSSLRALVCSGLVEGMQSGIASGLKGVIKRIDSLLEDYQPDFFIVLGAGSSTHSSPAAVAAKISAISCLSRRWSGSAKIQLVSRNLEPEVRAAAENAGCEVHGELVWGAYRFTDGNEESQLELQFMTVAGSPNYGVRTGIGPFGGRKLPAFLKGVGRITVPSCDPRALMTSVFKRRLERCDVFAVGHQRVLPLGKAGELKSLKGIARGLPISKATLAARKRAQAAPSAD